MLKKKLQVCRLVLPQILTKRFRGAWKWTFFTDGHCHHNDQRGTGQVGPADGCPAQDRGGQGDGDGSLCSSWGPLAHVQETLSASSCRDAGKEPTLSGPLPSASQHLSLARLPHWQSHTWQTAPLWKGPRKPSVISGPCYINSIISPRRTDSLDCVSFCVLKLSNFLRQTALGQLMRAIVSLHTKKAELPSGLPTRHSVKAPFQEVLRETEAVQ